MQENVGGYCRTSSNLIGQNIDVQIKTLKAKYPGIVIYMDEAVKGNTFSGRPAWKRLMKDVQDKKIDTIVFTSFDRFSRGNPDIDNGVLDIYFRLASKGVNLIFLDNPECNISVDMAINLPRQREIVTATARKAYATREHIREGTRAAKRSAPTTSPRKGKTYPTEHSNHLREILLGRCKDFGGDLTAEQCGKLVGYGKSQSYNVRNQLKAERSLFTP